jgi:unsaturated chondroitin disaccharide hydrolase
MKFSPLPLIAVLGLTPISAIAQTLEEKIETAMDFAAEQLEADLATRSGSNRFVSYTDTSGEWGNTSSSNWCSGFPAGLFWMMYDYTGESKWADYGRSWTSAVSSRATASDNDTGFQIFCSYGYGLRHASDALSSVEIMSYNARLVTAANTFTSERYHPTIGAYRAWQNERSSIAQAVSNPDITASTDTPFGEPYFEVNIDMMLNMELPTYVGLYLSDSAHYNNAVNHADTTYDFMVRQDGTNGYGVNELGSTYHVAGFGEDGALLYLRTHQGSGTDTTWSRGQAWAVYGNTMMYRYTDEERFLDRAEACFDYFMAALTAQSDDFVAYSDFDEPIGNGTDHPRDTSASAIVASAALELYSMTDEAKYLTAAENILNDLTSHPYLANESDGWESILTKGSEKYDYKAEEGTIFGDFYFVEAMLRYTTLMADPIIYPDTWAGLDVDDNGWVFSDFLGNLYIGLGEGYVYSYELSTWMYLTEATYEASASGAWIYFYK